jgi:NADH:ubiquinone oxidoreductase subunit 5 (subunit L)/multisubunit Na+/H+ antiporter MnhA subunit
MTPFIGSMVSVVLVFLLNRPPALEKMARLYQQDNIRDLHRFLSHKWYFDVVYNRLINQPLLETSYQYVFKSIDKGVLEVYGPTGLSKHVQFVGNFVTRLQTARVYDYGWFMVVTLFATYIVVSNGLPLEALVLLTKSTTHKLGQS